MKREKRGGRREEKGGEKAGLEAGNYFFPEHLPPGMHTPTQTTDEGRRDE